MACTLLFQGWRTDFASSHLLVLAAPISNQNDQTNPTPDQRRAMLAVVEGIKRDTKAPKSVKKREGNG